jgi:Na+/H+-dicarboxylate symporter
LALHYKILIGMALGAIAGGTANLGNIGWLRSSLISVEPVGTAFIRLITMIVVPLIVASIVVGAASLGDVRRLGRIGGKTVVYFVLTTVAAVTLGLVLSNLVKPGSRIDVSTRDALASQLSPGAPTLVKMTQTAPSIKDILLGIIPRNPVRAAADFELLPLIIFSVIFGAAMSTLHGDAGTAVLRFFEGVNQACTVIILWVMKLAPYAVFALIAAVVARFGLDLLRSLLIYALVVLLGLAFHTLVTLSLLVRFGARLSPLEFFRKIAAVHLFAFSTSSASATLPLTMETAEHKLGISRSISSFVLPLGATTNKGGTALYQAVAVMFIAQLYGMPFDIGRQLIVVLTATLASIGTVGVPSAGIITLIIVLQSAGLGAQAESGIALILGADRVLDMARTTVNVTGDLACAAVIARTEGEMHFPADTDLVSVP